MSATLILLFAFITTVSAHTGLTSSSPADGEVVVADIYKVDLEFNSKIESTSTVKVFNENEKEMIISNTQVNDHVMTGAFMSPLDKGTYTVEWKIIGADGHPIQGSYSFVVSQEEVGSTHAHTQTETHAHDSLKGSGSQHHMEDPIAHGETKKSVEKPVEQQAEATSKIASNDVLVVILVVLFTIAGGFVGWLIGRRQK